MAAPSSRGRYLRLPASVGPAYDAGGCAGVREARPLRNFAETRNKLHGGCVRLRRMAPPERVSWSRLRVSGRVWLLGRRCLAIRARRTRRLLHEASCSRRRTATESVGVPRPKDALEEVTVSEWADGAASSRARRAHECRARSGGDSLGLFLLCCTFGFCSVCVYVMYIYNIYTHIHCVVP